MSDLKLEDPDEQLAFQLATWQAVENMEVEFFFNGFIVATVSAIDAVNDIIAGRTYH